LVLVGLIASVVVILFFLQLHQMVAAEVQLLVRL
jgi:hypothetical protein